MNLLRTVPIVLRHISSIVHKSRPNNNKVAQIVPRNVYDPRIILKRYYCITSELVLCKWEVVHERN